MARSFRAPRAARRTNWLAANSTFRGPVAAGADDFVVCVDVGDSAQEESRYVDSTIVRVVGTILFDWDVSPSATGSQTGKAYAAVWCAHRDVGNFTVSTGLTRDEIMWAGLRGLSGNRAVIAGADSELLGQYLIADEYIDFDIRAMRKLHDSNRLVISVTNGGQAGAIALRWSFFMRVLIKER